MGIEVKGYHIAEIPKGRLGMWSKVEEEIAEYRDAERQRSRIMMMVELCDVFGALEHYLMRNVLTLEVVRQVNEALDFIGVEAARLGITETDIVVFSAITKRAFKAGERGQKLSNYK